MSDPLSSKKVSLVATVVLHACPSPLVKRHVARAIPSLPLLTRSLPLPSLSPPPRHSPQVPYEDEGHYVVVRHAALLTSTLMSHVLKVRTLHVFS